MIPSGIHEWTLLRHLAGRIFLPYSDPMHLERDEVWGACLTYLGDTWSPERQSRLWESLYR